MKKLTAKRFAEVIGSQTLADKLMQEVGGRRIPRLTQLRAQRRERDAQLLESLQDESLPYTQAARLIGISRWQASRIWRQSR